MVSDLASTVTKDQWVICANPEGSRSEVWPVVDFGEPRCALGLSRSGEWVWCELDKARVHPMRPPALVGVLPILELPYDAVVQKARVAARRAGVLPERMETELPSREIVEAALHSRSDYWVDLAAEWLRGMPSESVPVGVIEDAARDTGLPQPSRHGLLRALAEIRKR